MRVGEMMTRNVETVPAGTSLMAAAHTMRSLNIGFLPVVDGDLVVGVITDRDITLRGLGEGRVPQLTTVGDIMTRDLIWCHEEDALTEAATIMETSRVRRLLVLNDQKSLAGMISLDDLATHMSSDRLLGVVVRNVTAA